VDFINGRLDGPYDTDPAFPVNQRLEDGYIILGGLGGGAEFTAASPRTRLRFASTPSMYSREQSISPSLPGFE
jgi:hypothetical protein